MAGLDLVDWPAERTLTVAGSPRTFQFPVTLRDPAGGRTPVVEASFADMRPVGGGAPIRIAPAPVLLRFAGGGEASGRVRLRLDPATPPGRYEGRMRLGDISRTVAIDVLPEPKLDVRPAPLVVDAASGRKQRLLVGLDNRGNVPLTIDLNGAYPLAEEAPVAPDKLDAAGPLADVFDRLLGRNQAPTLIPFDGTLGLALPDGAERLDPGATRTLSVSLALPATLSPTARYHAFAPVYGSDLHIVIITAAKPPTSGRSAKTRGTAA